MVKERVWAIDFTLCSNGFGIARQRVQSAGTTDATNTSRDKGDWAHWATQPFEHEAEGDPDSENYTDSSDSGLSDTVATWR